MCGLQRRSLRLAILRAWILISVLSALSFEAGAAQYPCFNLTGSTLPGKTLWLKIDSATPPYETTGSYQLQLHADGSYTVPATNGIASRSGSWTTNSGSSDLTLTLKGYMGDAVNDVLVLFGGCLDGAPCTRCGYGLTREGVSGLQSGSYVLTDGEAPPSGAVPTVTSMGGGGYYPAGSSVFLYPQTTGNPNSLKTKWYKDGVQIPGATLAFLSLNGVKPEDSGVYRADISNSSGTVTVSTRVTVHPLTEAPAYLGRTWVKIVDEQTSITGTGNKIGRLGPRQLNLRDGTVLVLDPAGKGLLRWSKGDLTPVIVEGAALPGGATLQTISEATEESDGAVDILARHSLGFGIFEVKGANTTPVASVGMQIPQGNVPFAGFLWLTRRNGQLIFSAVTSANKVGVFSWNGTELSTLLAPGSELPGTLGAIQQVLALKLDGSTLVMQANDAVPYQGNNRQGIFRFTKAGGWTEIANATQPLPSNPSTTYKIFNGVDVANGTVLFTSGPSLGFQLYASDPVGPLRFIGPSASPDLVNAYFSAASPLLVFLRNPPNLDIVGNGVSERVLGGGELLDGKIVDSLLGVVSQGIDVAVTLKFQDGSTAAYAALGSPTTSIPLTLNTPVFAQGQMTFSFATQVGVKYQVEFKAGLSDPSWVVEQTLTGDGTTQTVSITPPGSEGFFRVVQVAP